MLGLRNIQIKQYIGGCVRHSVVCAARWWITLALSRSDPSSATVQHSWNTTNSTWLVGRWHLLCSIPHPFRNSGPILRRHSNSFLGFRGRQRQSRFPSISCSTVIYSQAPKTFKRPDTLELPVEPFQHLQLPDVLHFLLPFWRTYRNCATM